MRKRNHGIVVWEQVKRSLADERSGRVMFVAHCLLNQNTRYWGGASCAGIQTQALDELQSSGCGIIQMPCPEIGAWGGLEKYLIWLPLGKGPIALGLLKAMFPFFMVWTRLSYYAQARKVRKQIRSYQKAGFCVSAVMGIDGSPTCGVATHLDMPACFNFYAGVDSQNLIRKDFNERLYGACLRNGSGLFIKSLERQLKRGKMGVLFRGWSLPKELGINL